MAVQVRNLNSSTGPTPVEQIWLRSSRFGAVKDKLTLRLLSNKLRMQHEQS